MTDEKKSIPSVSVTYARNGSSTKANALGMRPMQERAYEKRGEQYLLIKSPPASGKSRALMFIALDKLHNQGLKQAIIVVPEKAIGASFNDEALSKFGFWTDWTVAPKWNLCNAPGSDNGGKVNSVEAFLKSGDKVLVCTHATFRFAVDRFGVEAFDDRLIAVDEFHHVSANPDNKLGLHLGQFIARDRVHIVAMTGSYFRGDAEAVLAPQDESKFDTVTYTYYEQLNGYEYLKQLDIGYFFYNGPYTDDILKVLDPAEKTIIHIPNVNSRESMGDKIKEVEHILHELGEWEGRDPVTGFQLVKTPEGRVLRIADLVDDDPAKRDRVTAALKDPAQKNNRDHVDIIIALGMAKEGLDWIWCEHALTVGYRSSLAELATTENKSGIIFDDPVSSLDHMHREAVAKRLVAEAARRQVIVFTHDLAFLFELNRAADNADPKLQVAISSVSRGADKAGFCRSEPPFKARRVSDITASLTNQLANERYYFDQGNEDEWRKTVKSIAGTLRDTWEIAVEEVVGHVIRRLSNEVKTPGLVKLTAITVADCEAMRDGFGRCSELMHSAAAALNRPLPRPDVLSAEISALAAWADSLRQRQGAARLP
ncbi:DEAD/DEAH box helicase [Bradyrhizobium sp. BTAi1]|jgi:hypothetical protein|uniref:DEAD/DEAH box helicase n=2 Tax=unclassified Bradyrhizobium TaxID=2631580 RepID=UPI00005DDC42|nr:DEAD/DEAH box helicase family protein [Bradyrhizobium sp. BTAi1]ABQ39532.1 hypothetical protein BBta_7689 [Bradyrhizobium sp. BTAi1]